MNNSRYRLSFTTGGLFSQESAMVAELYLRTREWDLTRNKVRAENLLQVRTAAAALRISKEVVTRLEQLSTPELQCVVDGTIRERNYLLWAAACRRYEFIREFAVEVLRDYYVTLRQELTLQDYEAFFNNKAIWHDELDNLKPSTQIKLRQNMFRMMRDADLISVQNIIQPAMFTPRIAELLSTQGREAFLIYPLTDTDINRWRQ
jgi:hypothetical protein